MTGTDHLYVVGENRDSAVVKIGRSVRPEARLGGIQTGYPRRLRLLHTEEGAGDLENDMHRLLSTHRASGEWFDFGTDAALPVALQAIAALKAIREVAALNSVTFTLAAAPRLSMFVDDDAEAESEPAAPRRHSAAPVVALVPRDPCELFALQQVSSAAHHALLTMVEDPVAYLLGQGVPAHHVECWARAFPRDGLPVTESLREEAERERANPPTTASAEGCALVPCRACGKGNSGTGALRKAGLPECAC